MPARVKLLPMLALMWAGISASPALAEADGPDYWRVAGVQKNDVLNLRSAPNARARIVARLSPDARSLRNLGCRGGLTFAEWQRSKPTQRQARSQQRWCNVDYQGRRGWVAGRFLREDTGPAQ